LFDKDMANIENIITKALVVSRLANKIAGETQVSYRSLFTIKIDNTSSANMRIRFGYNIPNPEDSVINDSTFNGKYADRTKEEVTVSKSPWIYLQIIGTKFKVSQTGIQVSLSAFSIVGSFIEKAKILRRFAIIRDEPTKILDAMNSLFQEASGGTLSIERKHEPIIPDNEDDTNYIEINLGSEVNMRTESWMTVRTFLDLFKDKIPPKMYKEDGTIIDDDNLLAEGEEASQSLGYEYNVITEKTESGKVFTKIVFYYPEPEKQTLSRTYIWKDYANSIVKSLEIDSVLDFAALNRQLFVYDRQTNDLSLFVARPETANTKDENENPGIEESQNFYLGRVEDKTSAISNDLFNDFNMTFVSDVIVSSSSSAHSSSIGARVAHQVVKYINQGAYKGKMVIPLDPFFLFDGSLRRYQYMIRILIRRPNYYNDGKVIDGGISYLSGYYLITDISHTINSSGGETEIGLMRWSVGTQ
jgi:hypothetical protein